MTNGWIKLYRDLLDKAIWVLSTPEQKTILITLLLMANHEEKDWEWRGKRFTCRPGQVVTSLEKIAKECGMGISIQNVRTAINRFEKLGFLTNESTKQNRLITICNWCNYQQIEEQTNKEANKELTDDQQRANKELTTNKNDKNVRKKEYIYPYQDIVSLWNEKCGFCLPKIQKITDARKSKIKSRLHEFGKEENWMQMVNRLFEKVAQSNFLCGQNKSGWKATFDWTFENEKNWVKIIEGNYDNERSNTNDYGSSGKEKTYDSTDRGIATKIPKDYSERF